MMGLSSLVRQWKSAILIVCVALLFSLGIAIQPAAAHRPHDVVTQVELSPDYSQDQTVLIVVRGNLYRSTDGGSLRYSPMSRQKKSEFKK